MIIDFLLADFNITARENVRKLFNFNKIRCTQKQIIIIFGE